MKKRVFSWGSAPFSLHICSVCSAASYIVRYCYPCDFFFSVPFSEKSFKQCRCYNSFIIFNNEKHNLKRLSNAKKIDLLIRDDKKVQIMIDDKQLLTNSHNDFCLKSYDLCLFIKLEIMKNKKEANVRTMPLTLSTNNLIDYLHMNKKGKNSKSVLAHMSEGKEGTNKYNCSYKSKEMKERAERNKKIFSDENESNEIKEERKLMENKIFENFENDIILYDNTEIGNREKSIGAICEQNRFVNKDEKNTIFSSFPLCLNYIKNLNGMNLYEEEEQTYNKYLKIFENKFHVKLKKAKFFETPEQEKNTKQIIWNLITNMNDEQIFFFFRCTQILNSFVFTYFFLNGYINYKEVYLCCNFEYVYQFLKWGYVFDVNGVKDADSMMTLSSLALMYELLIRPRGSEGRRRETKGGEAQKGINEAGKKRIS